MRPNPPQAKGPNMNTKSTLSAVALKDLQDILGARYVTVDPGLIAGNAWGKGTGGSAAEGTAFANIWPIAVVLPSTTEEVAAVVKCCIRHEIGFKAHSTGHGAYAGVGCENTISVDLRRMDSMEIIPEDRMAIIGPYATAGKLQAEALKHGMTINIVGAGPVHSPLASTTANIGVGSTSQGTTTNARNMLSWEWVSPDGEIRRGGSAGNDSGWFAGDGPGPGTRGLIRGSMGSQGGMGIFTKIGYKLFPVSQKGILDREGTGQFPQVGSKIPKNFGFYQAAWSDIESYTQATFELSQDSLTFAMLRMPAGALGWTIYPSNGDYVNRVKAGDLAPIGQTKNDKSWTILTVSHSEEEHKWRESEVKQAVQETGGWFVEVSEEHREVLFNGIFTSQYVGRTMRLTSNMWTSFGVLDSVNFMPRNYEIAERILAKQNKKGGNFADGLSDDELWAWLHEGGRYYWAEEIMQYDPASVESTFYAIRCCMEHFKIAWEEGATGLPYFEIDPLSAMTGERNGGAAKYGRRVKNAFDPLNSSRSSSYVEHKMTPRMEKMMPIIRHIFKLPFMLSFFARQFAKKGM